MKIPFVSFKEVNQLIKPGILLSFENFFDNAWYILGEQVKKFEQEYAAFNQVDYCIGVSNGLDALHIALKALGIQEGDEVIIPSNTYIATALSVSYVGATPVFVEPDINTYNINPSKIEAAITSRTKAIIPVHLYGQACEMDVIMSTASNHSISVIEDNAQSQGATYQHKLTGSFGNINGTSFYPGKNLGALGDAGAVTTNDAQLAKKAMQLRNYGSEKKYHHKVIGFNMRLDEVQAGFLSVKLQHLPMWTSQRQEIATWYNKALGDLKDIILPSVLPNATHVYHLYVIRHKQRDALQAFLESKGIGTLIHYPIPPHLQEAYAFLGFKKGDFPIAEELAATSLSLPVWPGLTKQDVQFVASAINEFIDENKLPG